MAGFVAGGLRWHERRCTRRDRPVICARKCDLYDLVANDSERWTTYADGLDLQRRLREKLMHEKSAHDALIVLQHTPTYTLGTLSAKGNLHFDPQAPPAGTTLFQTERGGEVTYHAPGQIVLYPILNLHYHRKDLHWYVWALEESVITALAELGVKAGRKDGHRGVWVGDSKVAATGVRITRWVTMHGISVNVRMGEHRKGYEYIVPCGISEFPVAEVADFRGDVELVEAARLLVRGFRQTFECEFVPVL